MLDARSCPLTARPKGNFGVRWTPRLFVADIDQPRSRRAGDVAAAVLCIVGLALLSLVAIPPSGMEGALKAIISAVPSLMGGLWRILTDILVLAAGALVVAALWRRRWSVLRDMLVGVLIAFGVALLVGLLVTGQLDFRWGRPDPGDLDRWVPWARLVWPVTLVGVAGPHIVRPFRVLGSWAIGLGVSGAVLAQVVSPTLGATSLLIGLLAAAVTALIFGSPKGRPDVETVRIALAELGVEVTELSPTPTESKGVFVLEAVGDDGRPLIVKVYGRDAYDTQMVSTVWRRAWFRHSGSPVSAGRMEQVGQEAYLTLLAEQKGIPTHTVVTAGLVGNGDALLVLSRRGDTMAAADWNTDRLAGLLALVSRMHEARITHGQVDHEHVILVGDRIGLSDYRGSRISSDPWRHNVDLVQALVTGSTLLGAETAIDTALSVLHPMSVEEMLPYMQPDTLTTAQRKALKAAGLEVDELREQAARKLEVEAPELVQLRRVSIGSILRAVLPLLAFFALASVFAGLDVDLLLETLASAAWWFVLVGILISQLPRLSQTMSAMGSSPIPIPASRLYLLQLAQSYIALSIPGGAARIALNTRFFQRHGMATGTALAVGAIDSFTGFLSQMFLLGLVFFLTSATLDLDLGNATSSGLVQLLLWMIAIGVLAALVFLAVPRLRRWAFGFLRELWSQARGALDGLATPRRLGLLLGGGILTETLFAVALGAFAVALGYPVGLPELILIVVLVGLAAGVLPVPGGIGVVEAGIIFGLARAGVPEEAAFAIAILYRAGTYYLPPAWGLFAFRYLEKNKHL